MAPNLDTAVLFYPRGGSAQVVRYLLHELGGRGWTTRLHAGSLGNPGDPSHGPTFYEGLDLRPFDYNAAFDAFTRGHNPQHAAQPFHPSYEDRGNCPDPLFSAVPPVDAERLTNAWTDHLAAHRSLDTDLLHLHHLSHLQISAATAYPDVPRVTTLHGTELKLIEAMLQRVRLSEFVGTSLRDLGRLLHSGNPRRALDAARLSQAAGLDGADAEMLVSTAWQKWAHSEYWLAHLKRAGDLAGQLVVVSEHDQQLAGRLLRLDTEPPVIANGVDTKVFQPQNLGTEQRLDLLRRWLVTDPQGWGHGGAPGSIRYTDNDLRRLVDGDGKLRPVLLWVGRFLDFKRVPVLLRAFTVARARLDPAPVLVMWGGYPGECEGTHPADLVDELGIADDVYFAGWRGHDELPLGLNCADLMVAPAVDEPFGMVYLEAMACGIPPVATATGGPARTIVGEGAGATGWLVKPDDVEALADTLVSAVLDADERGRRGANARVHIESSYSWSRTADKYLAAYDSARLARPRAALPHQRSLTTIGIDGLLLDMNGLFRHWRNAGARESERLAALPDGTIARYAYDHPAYRLARVGVLTDRQWADDVADRLAKDFGPATRDALDSWRRDRGEADPEMIDLLRRIREHLPVGVLSNCTDALRADLELHGIEFDHVFPSAELGVDKPSPQAFRLAAERMGISASAMAYFDDEPTFVLAARSVGMKAWLFDGAAGIEAILRGLGLPLATG